MNEFSGKTLEKRLQDIEGRIKAAQQRSLSSARNVRILGVSKRQPVERMRAFEESFALRGIQPVFGENYVQELQEKRKLFPGCRFHMIGRLQKNKVKAAVACADLIESIDTAELASAVNAEAEGQGKVLEAYLQINISEDPAKGGMPPQDLRSFIISALPALASLRISGLMTIVFFYDEPDSARKDYRALRTLKEEMLADARIKDILETDHLELSMGMSDDFEIAVEEGATELRIGTALFGTRELS